MHAEITWSEFSNAKEKRNYGIDPNARYQIYHWSIIDTQTYGRCIYIRELVEVGCYEFESSEISGSERLQIIDAVGQERITALLRENFEYKKRAFSEKHNVLEGIRALKEMAASEGIR